MFKAGDKVRCVEDAGSLSLGTTYTVLRVNEDYVYVQDNYGTDGGYFPSRFELVTEEKPKQYICETEWSWEIVESLDDIPENSICVWELGDELVKTVTWVKKESDQ